MDMDPQPKWPVHGQISIYPRSSNEIGPYLQAIFYKLEGNLESEIASQVQGIVVVLYFGCVADKGKAKQSLPN